MPSNTAHEDLYSDAVIASIEMVYGEGFLSPGGEPAVARIVNGIDLNDCTVLDVGCGLGGVLQALIKNHGAKHVHGIDLETSVLDRAAGRVEAAGITGQVKLEQTEPGPFPAENGAYDVVMCRDMLCHLTDKLPFYEEIIRVIKPGGYLIGSDWFLGPDALNTHDYLAWHESLKSTGLDFHFTEPEEMDADYESAGFLNIAFEDDTDWLKTESNGHLKEVCGASRDALTDALGGDGHQGIVKRTEHRIAALASGALLHMSFQAQKPD